MMGKRGPKLFPRRKDADVYLESRSARWVGKKPTPIWLTVKADLLEASKAGSTMAKLRLQNWAADEARHAARL